MNDKERIVELEKFVRHLFQFRPCSDLSCLGCETEFHHIIVSAYEVMGEKYNEETYAQHEEMKAIKEDAERWRKVVKYMDENPCHLWGKSEVWNFYGFVESL